MVKEGNRPIGLLDSGVGGLTVAREIALSLPEEELVYYGDTLHLPYGPRTREEVRGFVFKIIDFLIEEKRAKTIVLACNTATAFTLEEARRRYPVPVFGTLDGACKKAVRESRNQKIGVIGTEGTINSQAYQRALLELDERLQVFATACPRFVELVEEGNFAGREVFDTANRYLDGLKGAGIDVLILGCTHFPYLIPVIRRVMGDKVTLINPAVEMAGEVKKWLKQEGLARQNGSHQEQISQQEFLISDMKRISKTFLEKGSKFLKLPSLNFTEKNIFEGEEDDS
ncbi:MAG: glutamate racemase [Halanaerobiales bacterium]|nr:glutamate racemase [Halanaerobiales bacterium]